MCCVSGVRVCVLNVMVSLSVTSCSTRFFRGCSDGNNHQCGQGLSKIQHLHFQGRRKLIFTGPVELVGLGWGFEKQVFKVIVLLKYFDLTGLIMQLSSPGASSKMGLRENCLKFPYFHDFHFKVVRPKPDQPERFLCP